MTDTNDVTISQQEEYWNMWQHSRSTNSWVQRRSRIMLELLRSLDLQGPKILDFGCGNGWFCPELAKHGEVTGIDLSKANMAKAQQHFPNIEFIGANLFEHPLPTKHFDVVVSQQVIAHVRDQCGYVERCATLLKDGGYLILSTQNKLVMDRLGSQYVDDRALGHIESWLSFRDLKRLLDRDFVIRSHQSIIPMGHCGILRLVNSSKLNRILGHLFRPELLESIKERMGLGYINIVLAKKR